MIPKLWCKRIGIHWFEMITFNCVNNGWIVFRRIDFIQSRPHIWNRKLAMPRSYAHTVVVVVLSVDVSSIICEPVSCRNIYVTLSFRSICAPWNWISSMNRNRNGLSLVLVVVLNTLTHACADRTTKQIQTQIDTKHKTKHKSTAKLVKATLFVRMVVSFGIIDTKLPPKR